MRNVLVIGRSGQVAHALAQLRWADVSTQFMGRPDFDITQAGDLVALLGERRPQAVINASAYTAVDRAEGERDTAYAINRDGPAALARACATLCVPFLHLSTDYVFNGAKGEPYREEDQKSPLSVYGLSKSEGEDAVLHAYPQAVIVRTSWVFSAHGANFVKTMLRLAREGRSEVVVVADQRGRPTYAPDLAEVCQTIVQAQWAGCRLPSILHATNSDEAVWADVAEAVFAGAHVRNAPFARVRRVTTAEYPTSAARPADSRLDTTLVEKTFATGLRPWRAALDDCLELLLPGV